MEWTSVLAIYLLIWIATAFLSLPFGVKTHDELGLGRVPGQAESAPANFQPGRLALRATVIAGVLTAIYVANYVEGWVTAEDINLFTPPPELLREPV
jgi:predicted secreted protein